MPIGSVDPLELAGAVKTQIETVSSLAGVVEIIDALNTDDAEDLRKAMGAGPLAVRISFPKEGSLASEPGMNRVMLYRFELIVSVLFHNLGNAFTRLSDGPSPVLSAAVKSVLGALEGETLGILNQGGLACGPATIISRGGSLQAMQFIVTARSRELRS